MRITSTDRLYGIVVCLFLVAPVHSAADSFGASTLFADTAIIDVQLRGPLNALFDHNDNGAERPFVLSTQGVDHAIKVRKRGKSRLRVCDFPPLRLNFSADDPARSIFSGQNKLKLVTHCHRSTAAQVDMLQEYAAYRMFGLLTEIAYRVRLLRITYIDTAAAVSLDPVQRYAFVIETPKELANRVGGQRQHLSGLSLGALDDEHMATVYIFQYLIANTDWSLVTADADDECCHNGDILKIGASLFYVPYDFDLAGLVNARYARPDPSLRIRKVSQRLYRGFCTSREALQAGLQNILVHKADIFQTLRELPELSQKEIDAGAKFLGRFFDQANDTDKLLRGFERRCL